MPPGPPAALSLWRLFLEVSDRGGAERVTAAADWQAVATALHGELAGAADGQRAQAEYDGRLRAFERVVVDELTQKSAEARPRKREGAKAADTAVKKPRPASPAERALPPPPPPLQDAAPKRKAGLLIPKKVVVTTAALPEPSPPLPPPPLAFPGPPQAADWYQQAAGRPSEYMPLPPVPPVALPPPPPLPPPPAFAAAYDPRRVRLHAVSSVFCSYAPVFRRWTRAAAFHHLSRCSLQLGRRSHRCRPRRPQLRSHLRIWMWCAVC